MILSRKSIFEELSILKEEDGEGNAGGGDAGNANAGNDAPADAGGDEDFNIDTDLKQEDQTGEDAGNGGDDMDMSGDDFGGEDDMGDGGEEDTSSSSMSSSSSDNEDEEPNQANTDIFSSLSAQEQQIKIQELKNLYSQMYASSDDVMNRLGDIDNDIVKLDVLSRLSASMYRFRIELQDYITKVFPNKSYIENQISYLKFISILRTLTQVVDELYKQRQKDLKES